MGEMKTSTHIVNVLINNIPMALGVSALCEGMALLQGEIKTWIWPMYFINFCVSYLLANLIGWFMNPPKMCFGIAAKHGEPGSKGFGLWMGISVNTVYTTILVICMTLFNTQVLPRMNGGQAAPAIGVIMGILTNYVPVWILCFIISALWMKPAENIARAICNDPVK